MLLFVNQWDTCLKEHTWNETNVKKTKIIEG